MWTVEETPPRSVGPLGPSASHSLHSSSTGFSATGGTNGTVTSGTSTSGASERQVFLWLVSQSLIFSYRCGGFPRDQSTQEMPGLSHEPAGAGDGAVILCQSCPDCEILPTARG